MLPSIPDVIIDEEELKDDFYLLHQGFIDNDIFDTPFVLIAFKNAVIVSISFFFLLLPLLYGLRKCCTL